MVAFARRFGASRRGVAAIEMAFIVPVLAFLLAALVDFGNAIYIQMMVDDAAQSGAAYAQLNAATLWSQTTTYAQGATAVYPSSSSPAGQIFVSLVGSNKGNVPATATTDWATGPCTSSLSTSTTDYNVGCAWDTQVVDAAEQAHAVTSAPPVWPLYLYVSSSCTASLFQYCTTIASEVETCCISSGQVQTGSCEPPGPTAVTCSPTGLFDSVTVSSSFTTIVPYSVGSFSLGVPSTLSANYLVQIQ